MNKKYDEIMEHIEVTPEMRQRILGNIQNMDLTEKKSAKVIQLPQWRRFATLAACLALVLVGALTIPNLLPQGQVDPPDLVDGGIVEVATLEELKEAVGFEVTDWDSLPFQAEGTSYTAYWQDMAEIVYNGEGQTAAYRKGKGTEDISGDYNDYEAKTVVILNDISVTLKGDGEIYTLAIWTDGGFSYSLSLETGVSESEWESILLGAE